MIDPCAQEVTRGSFAASFLQGRVSRGLASSSFLDLDQGYGRAPSCAIMPFRRIGSGCVACVDRARKAGRSIWRGAVVLSAAAVLVKIMSAVYKLPYQNMAGDVGFYVYQQVYPFYAFAVALSGSGFPIVISRYLAVSESRVRDREIQRHALISLYLLCVLIFMLITWCAEPLSTVMGDGRLAGLIRPLAAVYLFVPLIAVLRGHFQAEDERMVPTAVSQIAEQLARVSLILVLSFYVWINHGNAYRFGAAAVAGCLAAPAVALVALLFFTKKKARASFRIHVRLNPMLVGSLLARGCLFSLLAMPLVVFQMADSMTLVPLLDRSLDGDPRVAKGIYDRAYLMTQIGMVVAASLTAAIVPDLAGLLAKKKWAAFRREAELALRISLIFGAAAACGLFAVGREVNIMLFQNDDGNGSFLLMSGTLLTLSMMITSSAILEVAGRPLLPAFHLLVGFAAKLSGNFLLVPHFSIEGAAVATLLSTTLTALLNMNRLRREGTGLRIRGRLLLKLVAALAGMVLVVLIWGRLVHTGFDETMPLRALTVAVVLPGTFIGAAVFLFMIVRLRCLNASDFARLSIPGRGRRKGK